MSGRIMKWDDFRELCEMDARNWHDAGWKSSDITAEDILGEYDEDYFNNSPDDEYDGNLSSFFTPEEIAAETLSRLEAIEAEADET